MCLSRVFVRLFFHREKVLSLQEFYILVGLTKLGQNPLFHQHRSQHARFCTKYQSQSLGEEVGI